MMSDGGGFKERMEAGIAAEIARRPEVRAKYEASLDGVHPDPIELSADFQTGEYQGIYVAGPFGEVASLRLADHTAPSGVHYRELHANWWESSHSTITKG